MRDAWRRMRALIRKEFNQLFRDKSNMAIGLVLPIILILLFGYGISLDVKNIPVAIVLDDSSPTAQHAVAGFYGSPYFSSTTVRSLQDGEALMNERKVDALVHLPADFSSRLLQGQAQIQVLVYGVDAARANSILSYCQAALGQWSLSQQARGELLGAGAAGQIQMMPRMWFNDANSSTWSLVPGLIVLIMTLVGAFLTALVMAREWERGTLESLFITPVRSFEILVAKIVPYFCVGMFGWALSVLGAKYLFEVPVNGSWLVLILASMLYMLVCLGIGLLISSATKNQFLASQLALIISLMPALMLSGFLFDLRNVPTVVRWVGHALPSTYFMELIKSLFLSGNVWSQIVQNCAILAAYAIGFLYLAYRFTQKKLDQ